MHLMLAHTLAAIDPVPIMLPSNDDTYVQTYMAHCWSHVLYSSLENGISIYALPPGPIVRSSTTGKIQPRRRRLNRSKVLT